MRKQTRAAASLMVAGIVLAGCGTAPPDEPEIEDPSDESAETESDDDADSDSDDGEESPPPEVDVIEEFEDEPWSVAANFDEAAKRMDVTVFADPGALSEDDLDDIEQRVTEVSGAESVNVVVSDEEVPEEN